MRAPLLHQFISFSSITMHAAAISPHPLFHVEKLPSPLYGASSIYSYAKVLAAYNSSSFIFFGNTSL
jgi:hypothetical protein